jgi:predicted DNA-binding transcriptional regulator AlpA
MKRPASQSLTSVVTSSQAADILGITRRWFYELVKTGRAPASVDSIGHLLVWDKAAIEKMRRDTWQRIPS